MTKIFWVLTLFSFVFLNTGIMAHSPPEKYKPDEFKQSVMTQFANVVSVDQVQADLKDLSQVNNNPVITVSVDELVSIYLSGYLDGKVAESPGEILKSNNDIDSPYSIQRQEKLKQRYDLIHKDFLSKYKNSIDELQDDIAFKVLMTSYLNNKQSKIKEFSLACNYRL